MFVSAFKYKKAANKALLDIEGPQLDLLNEKDKTFFLRILNHTSVVDSLFISRLSDTPELYQADNTLNTPTIDELRAFMLECDDWLIEFAKHLTPEIQHQRVSFQFVDGDNGSMSVPEVLLHLLMHGSNHRGMASRVLASNDLERPKDTFTRYLHQVEPHRRMSKKL